MCKKIPDHLREEYPFESHFASIPISTDTKETAKMHYIDEGKSEVPIIFVHGNPSWSFYFRNVVKNLSREHRCIAVDHLGCGFSEKKPTFRFKLKDRITHIERLLTQLNISKCHLVVHDWGGAIGCGVAVRNPQLVEKLVITNTAAFPSEQISWRINLCRTPVVGRLINYHLNGFLSAAMHMTTVNPLSPTLREAYLLPYKNLQNRESIDRFVKDIPMKSSHPSYETLEDISRGLSRIKQENLMILWGMKDFCFHKGFLKEWVNRFPKSESHRFEKAGHFLFEDALEKTTELIEEFFDRKID
ncbi:MAG: alpha/beta fold hydrolase [Opitutales bacterium]|nr:alpha/beta fold hydrolase [Opitutales bacterium]